MCTCPLPPDAAPRPRQRSHGTADEGDTLKFGHRCLCQNELRGPSAGYSTGPRGPAPPAVGPQLRQEDGELRAVCGEKRDQKQPGKRAPWRRPEGRGTSRAGLAAAQPRLLPPGHAGKQITSPRAKPQRLRKVVFFFAFESDPAVSKNSRAAPARCHDASFPVCEQIQPRAAFLGPGEHVVPPAEPVRAPGRGLVTWNLNRSACKFFGSWPNTASCFWGGKLRESHKKTQRASWISKGP